MGVKVKGYLTFKEIIGERIIQVDESQIMTLMDLVLKLAEECAGQFRKTILDPETGGVQRQIAILINGQHHTHLPMGLETILKDGDEIAIFPPLAGG